MSRTPFSVDIPPLHDMLWCHGPAGSPQGKLRRRYVSKDLAKHTRAASDGTDTTGIRRLLASRLFCAHQMLRECQPSLVAEI